MDKNVDFGFYSAENNFKRENCKIKNTTKLLISTSFYFLLRLFLYSITFSFFGFFFYFRFFLFSCVVCECYPAHCEKVYDNNIFSCFSTFMRIGWAVDKNKFSFDTNKLKMLVCENWKFHWIKFLLNVQKS